jgi:hypothetical protein
MLTATFSWEKNKFKFPRLETVYAGVHFKNNC